MAHDALGDHNEDGARRVLLKLSGEMFGGGAVGLDANVLTRVAAEIAVAVKHGVQVAIVVGGGNFFRGAELQRRGMDRARADYMGMLGTVMNAIALQDFVEQTGTQCRVQTAIEMIQVAEPYVPLRAIRHLQKGRVVIFGAGAGMPYFSTDTVAAQRALELRCDEILVGKNGVDGVYADDPNKNTRLRHLPGRHRPGAARGRRGRVLPVPGQPPAHAGVRDGHGDERHPCASRREDRYSSLSSPMTVSTTR